MTNNRDLVGAAAEAGSGVETEAEALAAKDREIERLNAEREAIIGLIPMDYLKANDVGGATGPTRALNLVQALRDYSNARWRIIERLKAEEAEAEILRGQLAGCREAQTITLKSWDDDKGQWTEALAAKEREIERLKAERDDAVAKRGKWCDDVRANITATRREMFAQFARAEAAEAANTRLTSQVEKLMEITDGLVQHAWTNEGDRLSIAHRDALEEAEQALRTVYDSIKEGLGEAAADAGLSGVTEVETGGES